MRYKYEEGYSLVPVREPSSMTRSLTEPREMNSPSFACTKVMGTFGVLTTGGIFKNQVSSNSEIGGSIVYNRARIAIAVSCIRSALLLDYILGALLGLIVYLGP
jgi:hypothetical protein